MSISETAKSEPPQNSCPVPGRRATAKTISLRDICFLTLMFSGLAARIVEISVRLGVLAGFPITTLADLSLRQDFANGLCAGFGKRHGAGADHVLLLVVDAQCLVDRG